jgi:hypothetical protein
MTLISYHTGNDTDIISYRKSHKYHTLPDLTNISYPTEMTQILYPSGIHTDIIPQQNSYRYRALAELIHISCPIGIDADIIHYQINIHVYMIP